MSRRHHLILALLVVAGTAFALMQTLVVPSLPFFQREFGASASATTWLVTSFLLSSSVLTPVIGKLGDAHGKKRMLVISLLVFGGASLGAAGAWNIESLIGFRALQGTGAAIFPLSFGIIRDEFPAQKVGVAIGTVSSVFGIGGGFGLVLSGLIIDHLGWHWLFLIGGVPVLIAAALVWRLVPESAVKTPARPDYPGALALSIGFAALLLAISLGIPALYAFSVVTLAAWVWIERRVAEPLVDLATLLRPGMSATNASTFLVGFSLTAFFVLAPGFLQAKGFGFGLTPSVAGVALLPFSLAMIVAGPFAGALGTKHGRVLPLRVGLALGAGSLGGLAVAHAHVWTFVLWLPVMGAGMAFCLAAIGALVIDHSRPEETGVTSAMNTIMRASGAAVGAQIAAALVSAGPSGYTSAFAMGSLGLVAALAPTLVLAGPRRRLVAVPA